MLANISSSFCVCCSLCRIGSLMLRLLSCYFSETVTPRVQCWLVLNRPRLRSWKLEQLCEDSMLIEFLVLNTDLLHSAAPVSKGLRGTALC